MEHLLTIIAGCKALDRRCQRLFYDQYRGYASRIVFRYVYRYQRVTDIVTDGFVKIFNHFPTFEIRDENLCANYIMAWIKKVMIHTAIDELRKNSMLPEIGSIDDHNLWEISDRNDDADRLLLYTELIQLIKDLPPNLRTVFNMSVIDGYSHAEIAEQLNIAEGTSRSSLSRAKVLLQERLKKMENDKKCRIKVGI